MYLELVARPVCSHFCHFPMDAMAARRRLSYLVQARIHVAKPAQIVENIDDLFRKYAELKKMCSKAITANNLSSPIRVKNFNRIIQKTCYESFTTYTEHIQVITTLEFFERSIFQTFWKVHCCAKFLFIELETSNFGYLLIF